MKKISSTMAVNLDLAGVFLSSNPNVVEFTVRIKAEEPLPGRVRNELAQYYFDWVCRPTKEPSSDAE